MVEGLAKGERLTFDEEMVIGRAESGEGRLGDDPELSRKHARVFREAGRIVVEDLGSANGTYVNAVRLSAPRILEPGDVVRMGRTTLELTGGERSVEPATPPPAPPRPAAIPIAAARPAPSTPAAPADALPVGAVFAGCRVEEVIGFGDMGVVLPRGRARAPARRRPQGDPARALRRGPVPRALPPRIPWPPRRSTTRTSSRSSTPARRTGRSTSRCGSSRAPTCVPCWPPTARCSRPAPRGSSARSAARWMPPTRAAWCTATSSRPTCCWREATTST